MNNSEFQRRFWLQFKTYLPINFVFFILIQADHTLSKKTG